MAVPLVAEKLTLEVAVTTPVRVMVIGATCDSSPGNAGMLNCIVVVAGVAVGVTTGVGVGVGVGVRVGDGVATGVGVPQVPPAVASLTLVGTPGLVSPPGATI